MRLHSTRGGGLLPAGGWPLTTRSVENTGMTVIRLMLPAGNHQYPWLVMATIGVRAFWWVGEWWRGEQAPVVGQLQFPAACPTHP